MKKRSWYILGAAALVILAAVYFLFLFPRGGSYDNLIVNGNFESLNGEGLPRGWYTDEYFHESFTFYDAADGRTGKGARIVSDSLNDARFAQRVSVSPDTLYHLHGYIRANAENGLGANLSIEGVYVFSESIYDTAGEWQEVSLYGRTGPSQRSITVFARLGGYSGESSGEAWFDDITLHRVDDVPAGYWETLWYQTVPAAPAAEDTLPAPATGALPLAAFGALYAVLFLLAAKYLLSPDQRDLAEKGRLSRWLAAGVLGLGFIVRVLMAVSIKGYDVDIGCFRSWAATMAAVGPAKFYSSGGFCDYPPGYLWVLWLVGGLGRLFGTGVTELMVKMPPILADLALCAALYHESKKHLPAKAALALCLLYALNPLILITSAAWGQADSLMTLLLMLVVMYALRGAWKAALPLYVAAVLMKPQALMFGPLGLAAFIMHMLQSGKEAESRRAMLRDVGMGLGLAAAAALVIALPFSPGQPWDWLITLYGSTMGHYGHATVNACNIYFLLGKNWVGTQNPAFPSYVPLLVYLLAAAPLLPSALRALSKGREALREKENFYRFYILGGLTIVLGAVLLALSVTGYLTYARLGMYMVVYCVALFVTLLFLSGDIQWLPLLGGVMLLMLFNTGAMMHERYLFPAAALLFFAYALKKDRRILWLALGVTLAGFLNVGCALDRNIRIGGAPGHLDAPAAGIHSDMSALEYLAALLNMATVAGGLALCCGLCRRDARIAAIPATVAGKRTGPAVKEKSSAPLPVDVPHRAMTKKDWAVMLTATVLYAVLAFSNLGSTKAPQTAWVSRSPSEQVTLDLGRERAFQIFYYPGIHRNASDASGKEIPIAFTVEVGSDGEFWEQSLTGTVTNGDCFKWKYLAGFPVTGRYVRLTANAYGLRLFEMLFRDAETGESIPAAVIGDFIASETGEAWVFDEPLDEEEADQAEQALPEPALLDANNETVAFLADEPDTLEGEPGWYNSTYFDEIYHARTGYEHLHGLHPYETTHPPLGKVFISWCIALFGMTPFGWRFAGALAGVLMLPGMYLLGHILIKKKWGGFGAMMLLALDLMHFTQTRIATIDSFVVLFIIWMIYFMLRWFFLDFFRMPFWKTLVPLALSGVMMGLGVASKWTACYAGVVLAIIFFWGIWRRYRLVLAAQAMPPEARTEAEENAAAWGVRSLLSTIVSCLLFFVAVPVMIYFVSYIPYFAPSDGVSFGRVIAAAQGMLNYHATPGLGMDHPYYSPWYQWPVIGKPMWYASSAYEPAGWQSTIMAMGNPAVWWAGLAGIIGVLCLWAWRHVKNDYSLALYARDDDPRYALVLICFAVQLLPWVLVPRGTYIYHYFPCVPFIILAVMLCLDRLGEAHEKAARIALYCLVAVAAALFIAFFPYASGVTVPQGWLDSMKWFPNWLYY